MSSSILLLNSNYQFHALIDRKKAIKLLYRGKCEIIVASEEYVENSHKTIKIVIPKVLRLLNMVKSIFRNEIPFSKRNVFYRDRNTCQYCGKEFQKNSRIITIDHVTPVSRGGKHTFENCVCACRSCNEYKGNKTPSEAGLTLKKNPTTPTVVEFITMKSKTIMEEFSWDKIMEQQSQK